MVYIYIYIWSHLTSNGDLDRYVDAVLSSSGGTTIVAGVIIRHGIENQHAIFLCV